MSAEVLELNDAASGARALIFPDRGFNCASCTVQDRDEAVELLWKADGFETGAARPTSSGIPILFPFAGRLAGTSFEFQGRSYELSPGDPLGNAIHGFACFRPWRVIEQASDRVVGEFRAADFGSEILAHWPADFRLTADYRLQGASLRLELVVENLGDRTLPFGLGTHPYFRLPLGSAGSADDCVVRVPATTYWELVDMLPTGRKLPLEPARQLAAGRPFMDMQFDDVLSDLEPTQGRHAASIDDARSGRRLTLEFDQAFGECVVYTPPHRGAVCIEPYTTVPDAFSLAQRGIDAGLQTLPPGGAFRACMEIRCETLPDSGGR
jgi:aldose 1-epimerase